MVFERIIIVEYVTFLEMLKKVIDCVGCLVPNAKVTSVPNGLQGGFIINDDTNGSGTVVIGNELYGEERSLVYFVIVQGGYVAWQVK
jgi:hypothetical protein